MKAENLPAFSYVEGLVTALKLNLLEETLHKLNKYFDADKTKYALRRTVDPDTGAEDLLLEIHTGLNCEESMRALERFEDDWWLDNRPADSSLVIDVRPT